MGIGDFEFDIFRIITELSGKIYEIISHEHFYDIEVDFKEYKLLCDIETTMRYSINILNIVIKMLNERNWK